MTKDNQMIRVTVWPLRSGQRKRITQVDSATVTDVRLEDDGAQTGVISNGMIGFAVRRECGQRVWHGEINRR